MCIYIYVKNRALNIKSYSYGDEREDSSLLIHVALGISHC